MRFNKIKRINMICLKILCNRKINIIDICELQKNLIYDITLKKFMIDVIEMGTLFEI